MAHERAENLPLYKRLNWVNTIFLIISPILVLVFLPIHYFYEGLDWRLLALFLFYLFATGLSITAGYHRLFAHRSYEASLPVKLFYLIFGAVALQGSVIKWASDHRRHHRHVDGEEDPYSIKHGFFYAHMGWVFFKDDPRYREQRAADLVADKWLVWQDKYVFPIAIYVGFWLPTLIGLSFGDPVGGLLYGCLLRVVLTHHSTFFINSLCHMLGTQPYTDKNSAKDSFIMAFFTHGEGYHNFHHRFEADYRNGIRWYHWDPTKWLINFLAFCGLAKNLKKISELEIFRAKLQQQERRLMVAGVYNEKIKEMRLRVEEAKRRILVVKKRYHQLKSDLATDMTEFATDMAANRDEKIRQIKAELQAAKKEFHAVFEQWQLIYQTQAATLA